MVLICIFLVSCNNYNKVKSGENDNSIIYDENIYYEQPQNYWSCLSAYSDNELIEIGWSWFIPLLGTFNFYSDTESNPDFIFCLRGNSVWINDSYDYTSQNFIVIDTDLNIRFDKTYVDKPIDVLPKGSEKITEFSWCPENHKALINSPIIYKYNNDYLINFDEIDKEPYYYITNDFLDELLRFEIIKN